MLRRIAVCVLILVSGVSLHAQRKALTLGAVFDPAIKENFSGNPQKDLIWIDDRSFLWPKTDSRGEVIDFLLVDTRTGTQKVFLDQNLLRSAIGDTRDGDEDEAARLTRRRKLALNEQRDAILLTISNDIFVYSIRNGKLTQLTSTAAAEEEASFSPDGSKVAFIRDNDLYVMTVTSRRETRLTTDGGPDLLNGKLDWVYQEEIYGRGIFRGYWWSPDSSRIAMLQLDESNVPRFTIVDHIPYHQKLEVINYPKAGDPNPAARLFVIDLATGDRLRVEDAKYADQEVLFVDVSWSPDARDVLFQVQDREQTWLDLNAANAARGTSRTLFRDETPAWVERIGSPHWIGTDNFLWLSERTGYKHLFLYRRDGTLLRQVTKGPWEVRTLHGVDPSRSWIYFSGTERSPTGLDVYRVRTDGSRFSRLTSAPGTHTAVFNASLTHFLDTWSDVTTPPQIHLRRADGGTVRTVDQNPAALLQTHAFIKPEFLQVPTRDGFMMEAMLIKPVNFDPSRTYPVYQHTYGGPQSQQVKNSWSESTGLFHQVLANNGIIVWVCDNRSASGKGAVSAWPIYRNLGELELRDLEDGLSWLKQHPWVDGTRVMINGWSYGGFMSSYALTHSRSFVAGIVGAPVTDWRDYDSVYTERYMLRPQNNEAGYRKAAPRFAGKEIHGKVLIVHGLTDDNVHVQNSIQLAYELQEAGTPFEMMFYPRARHGITDAKFVWHMRQLMLDFILRNLKP